MRNMAARMAVLAGLVGVGAPVMIGCDDKPAKSSSESDEDSEKSDKKKGKKKGKKGGLDTEAKLSAMWSASCKAQKNATFVAFLDTYLRKEVGDDTTKLDLSGLPDENCKGTCADQEGGVCKLNPDLEKDSVLYYAGPFRPKSAKEKDEDLLNVGFVAQRYKKGKGAAHEKSGDFGKGYKLTHVMHVERHKDDVFFLACTIRKGGGKAQCAAYEDMLKKVKDRFFEKLAEDGTKSKKKNNKKKKKKKKK